MLPRDWRLRIEDILEAIRKIQHCTKGMTPATFFAKPQALDAVAYNFIIICIIRGCRGHFLRGVLR